MNKKKILATLVMLSLMHEGSNAFAYETIGNVIEIDEHNNPYYIETGDDVANSFSEDTTLVYDKTESYNNYHPTVGARWESINSITSNKILKIIGSAYSSTGSVGAGVVYSDAGGKTNFYGKNIIIESMVGGTAVIAKGAAAENFGKSEVNFYNDSTEIIGNTHTALHTQSIEGNNSVAPSINIYGNLKVGIDRTNKSEFDTENNVYAINQQGGTLLSDKIAIVDLVANENDKYAIGLWQTAPVNDDCTAISTAIFNGKTEFDVNGGAYAYGIYGDSGSQATFNDSLTITAKNFGEKVYGIYLKNNSELNSKGEINITANADNGRSHGIYLTGNSNLETNNKITIVSNSFDDLSYGMYSYNSQLNFENDISVTANASNDNSYGMYLNDSNLSKVKDVIITAYADNGSSYGMYLDDSHLVTGNNISVTANSSNSTYGLYLNSSDVNTNGILNINTNSNGTTYGLFLKQSADFTSNGGVITTNTVNSDASNVGSYVNWYSDAVFKNDVIYNTNGNKTGNEVAALSRSGSSIDYQKGLVANSAVVLNAVGNVSGAGSTIDVNSSKSEEAIVRLDGKILVGKTDVERIFNDSYDVMEDDDSTNNKISVNLLNANSYFTGVNEFGNEGSEINLTFDNGADWNMTDSTTVTNLVLANGADLNVNYDKVNSTDYRTLTAENFTGEGGIVNLDIDASTNINNSDRIFVNGTHKDTHYITLNNVGANTDGAEGTVLVSVNDEQGKFEANDSEGALYWNRYDLDSKESTTDGYNTDWYLKEVEQLDEPTTSVDTILGANALGYHTWRAETDKLMKRMGDLRHNGEDEKGAWFRVRGAEISRDGEASFENKYTVYELGYDEMTKKTDRFTRYQGAALSYIDGTSSFARGSGENDGKSIAFYTTEMRNKGHYLDLVFRIANMDSDYKVYDTNGNKITGEPENVGVSLSAEYGRKKVMDDNGWYIEPQGQLTVGYFGGDNYRAKYADQYIDVHQSGIPSVLGRIGFNIGRDIDENTNIYLKANLLHEFCGDYDVDMVDSAGNRRTESDTFNDTWFEYGIGAAIKTGKNNHLYFDFEKTAGGDFEKDWAWNAGMRWTF